MMRRKEKQLTAEKSFEIVEKAEWGVLSLVCDGSSPYSIPMSFALDGMKLYLHGAKEGMKIDLIGSNNAAAFTCVGSTEVIPQKFTTKYESAVICGTIRIVEDENERYEGLMALVRKYSPGFMEEGKAYIERAFGKTAVLAIDIGEITGKAQY
ncbi:MAG: pyridoxamine 5'-phosphate oxidase family protein [Sphaerochaetaceae bacterium]|nr:pyridoxamine 5'-phosphate oxidase family protein [Sphaerochaetaceae bacterium]